MRKYLSLISSTILAAGSIGSALADDLSCVKESDFTSSSRCDELGYIFDAATCGNISMVMKCPFDTSKVWCLRAKEKPCAVGDTVYSDNKCYVTADHLPPGVETRGVVFDTTNKLAFKREAYGGSRYYIKTSYIYGTQPWSLVLDNPPIDPKCGAGTSNIVGCKVSGVTAVQDLMTLSGDEIHEPLSDFSGLRSTENDMVGYLETLALYRIDGAAISGTTHTLVPQAAKYCMEWNDCHAKQNNTCLCEESEQNMMRQINPYFLPRIGDLITLARNYSSLSEKLNFGETAQVLSSTMAYSTSGRIKKYDSVWDVMVAASGFPSRDFVTKVTGTYGRQTCTFANPCLITYTTENYVFAHSFQYSDKPVGCVYYYGNNYLVNTANTCSQ